MKKDTAKIYFSAPNLWFTLALAVGVVASVPGMAAVEFAAAVEAGRRVAADRKLGNCYSCHHVAGAELAGNTAPPLVYMKKRFPDPALLRAQIADPRQSNPNTIMPPYGAHGILTEQEIDQLVDYVLSL